jgi:hypothetical protein
VASGDPIYASVSGEVYCYDSAWADVVAATGDGESADTTTQTPRCGTRVAASPAYTGFQLALKFDTSGIPDDATITGAKLYLYGQADNSTQDFTLQCYEWSDWGTLNGADFLAASGFAAKTLLASFATSGFSTGGYNEFTSESAFLAAINKSGTTWLWVTSDRYVAGTEPSTNEYVAVYGVPYTGTSRDPYIVVEYTTGGAPAVLHNLTLMGAGTA